MWHITCYIYLACPVCIACNMFCITLALWHLTRGNELLKSPISSAVFLHQHKPVWMKMGREKSTRLALWCEARITGKAAKPAVRARPGESSCAGIQRRGFHWKLYLFQSPQKRRAGPLPCTGTCRYVSSSYIIVYKTQKIQTLIGLLFCYLWEKLKIKIKMKWKL